MDSEGLKKEVSTAEIAAEETAIPLHRPALVMHGKKSADLLVFSQRRQAVTCIDPRGAVHFPCNEVTLACGSVERLY